MIPVLEAIQVHPDLCLRVYVAGEHLSDVHGQSSQDVTAVFPEALILPAVLAGDTPEDHAAYLSRLQSELTRRFSESRPDAVLILGDRGEMLVTALVASYLRIPIVHLHGGELTSTIDNAARFAISRLAHLHLPALESAARRLRATGEHADRIRVVGAPALDRIRRMPRQHRDELFTRLKLDPSRELVFVTQHPMTETAEQAGEEMRIVLEAAGRLHRQVLVVHPHLDPGGSLMLNTLANFRDRSGYYFCSHLGHVDFLSVARASAVWIGNSSAGVIESMSLGVPVVNIGTRQAGRERGGNVVDATLDIDDIVKKAELVMGPLFRSRFREMKSPWGDGQTGPRVADILAAADLAKLVNKDFDFPV